MASIEAHIIELKTLRRDIDSLITRIKGMSASRETQLAVQHLEDAGMRLGCELGRIHRETGKGGNPYPNSKDPSNTLIEPPADKAARPPADPGVKFVGLRSRACSLAVVLFSTIDKLPESDTRTVLIRRAGDLLDELQKSDAREAGKAAAGPSNLEKLVSELHDDLSLLSSHVQAQNETIAGLRTQVAHQIELVANLADGGKVAEILDLEKQVDSLNKQNQEATYLANIRADEVARLTKRIQSLCDRRFAEVGELTDQLSECKKFANDRNNLANVQTEKCARLHDENAQLRVELEDNKNELLRRQGVLDAFQASHDNFKSRAQNAEEKVKVLQSQLNSTIDQLQGQRVTISDLDAKCMVLNKEMGDLVKQRDQLASVLNQITNQLRDSECKGQKLAKECDERLKKIKELNAQIECLNRDAQALRSRNVAFASSAGWQPIETAPKDGTYILIRQRSDDSPVGFNAHVCKHDATFPHLPWTTSYGMILGTNPNAPVTHWMPLPPAPGSPGPAAGSSHSEAVARLIAAFESALMIKPHLWFEIGYTSPTDWMVHILDKSRSQSEGQKIIETQGPIEAACNHARAKLEDYIFKPAS